jgi:hypothetical protein
MNARLLKTFPSNSCMEAIVLRKYPELYNDYKILELQRSHRPEEKVFYDKPHDTGYYTRRRTRPWDNCWFSKKPEYIVRTVEDVFKMNPGYLLWCYTNLNIKWSEHTIKLFKTNPNFKLKNKTYDCYTFNSTDY